MADDGAHSGWFRECLQFLYDHHWVYDWQVTRLFVDEVCQKIPADWMECLLGLQVEELNSIPYGLTKEEWPESFVHFISTALKLSACEEGPTIAPAEVPADLRRGMTPKKQHEVSLVASFIHKKLTEASLNTIVDVGAGLGYLGQVLRRLYGYRVISLECDELRTHAANQRAQKQGETFDVSSTLTFDLQDNPEVMRRFGDLLADVCKSTDGREVDGEGSGHRVCLAGLHCCGDLSPTMLKYFSQLEQIGLLVCVSCCYHRMATVTDSLGTVCHRNFPMSQSCQAAMVSGSFGNWNLGTPAFRLAAQETRCRWRSQNLSNHQSHSQHVAYRAILELFCVQEGLELKKSSRQLVPKQKCERFEDYVTAVLQRARFTTDEESEIGKNPEEWKEKLYKLFSQTEKLFSLIEPITCLQVLLQPVLETLIHKDRLAFLREHNLHAEILPLFDASISPRNTVLIAKREKGITKT